MQNNVHVAHQCCLAVGYISVCLVLIRCQLHNFIVLIKMDVAQTNVSSRFYFYLLFELDVLLRANSVSTVRHNTHVELEKKMKVSACKALRSLSLFINN